jgi:transcriptional regulator with XRE-family HTH domain
MRERRPDDLMSAVLRRLMLWRSATFLEATVESHDTLRMSWRNGPPARAIATILTESTCGLGPITVAPYVLKAGQQSLLVARSDYLRRTPSEPHGAWLEISRSFDRRPTWWSLPTVHFWDQREMRGALSHRDISQIYRLLRRRGVSQRQIAALTGQSRSEVSEILKGRQVMAYDVLAGIADGLSIPRGYMGLAYDEVTAVQVAMSNTRGIEEDESAKRRRFLAHAAAVTMGSATMGRDVRRVAKRDSFGRSNTGLWVPHASDRLALPNGQCSHCGFHADLAVDFLRRHSDSDLGTIVSPPASCPRCAGSSGFQRGQESWTTQRRRPAAAE